jgi:hypothetical protein
LTGRANSRIIYTGAISRFSLLLTSRAKFGKLLALVLCVVFAVFMTVEVAHTDADDPTGAADSTHCQLCATAHVAVDTQPTWLTAYVMQLIERISIGEPDPGSSAVVVTAFIRPPPFSR